MCFKRPAPLTDIFAVHVVPFSLVSCLLCRTVMAAIHRVALVPGINTNWPPVCLRACMRECVCVCVCVLDHVQESNACVCPYQLYPYFTLYCFYCSQYKVDALTIKKTTFQLLSCYLKSDFTHKMPKMPLKIVIPPFHQCIPYLAVFAFKK